VSAFSWNKKREFFISLKSVSFITSVFYLRETLKNPKFITKFYIQIL